MGAGGWERVRDDGRGKGASALISAHTYCKTATVFCMFLLQGCLHAIIILKITVITTTIILSLKISLAKRRDVSNISSYESFQRLRQLQNRHELLNVVTENSQWEPA